MVLKGQENFVLPIHILTRRINACFA